MTFRQRVVHIIANERGQTYTSNEFKTNWQRLMNTVIASGVVKERFTFHDLKRKGVSDTKGNKQEASGHRNAAMLNIYDVKSIIVKAAGEK
ncbi:MAG TPA: hypothetical protein VIF37_18980 [Methylobacter sp.]|jgi:hypothetical protein